MNSILIQQSDSFKESLEMNTAGVLLVSPIKNEGVNRAMKNFMMTGDYINLKEALGNNYKVVSKYLEEEIGATLEELLEGIRVVKMDFSTSLEAAIIGLFGCYIEKNNQVWLRDLDNLEIIVHEFVHVNQFKRKGVKNQFKKKLTNFSNAMLRMGIPFFYWLDPFEREARNVAKKFKNQ